MCRKWRPHVSHSKAMLFRTRWPTRHRVIGRSLKIKGNILKWSQTYLLLYNWLYSRGSSCFIFLGDRSSWCQFSEQTSSCITVAQLNGMRVVTFYRTRFFWFLLDNVMASFRSPKQGFYLQPAGGALYAQLLGSVDLFLPSRVEAGWPEIGCLGDDGV